MGGPLRFRTEMKNCLDLTGRVAVVVGATSGIGRAIALGLAEHGADVVPSGRRRERVAAVCREIEAAGASTICQPSDVRDRDSLLALHDAVLERFGRADILVNAAGYTFRQPTLEVCEAKWSALLDTNLTGALRTRKFFTMPSKPRAGEESSISLRSVRFWPSTK
jgi:NAD(P)-dependent dehydrogenase (short-subunit alcohol dehydrogenase family)